MPFAGSIFGQPQHIKAMIKRRSAIEPTIGHMKSDGRLGRNWLKGASAFLVMLWPMWRMATVTA
jgi:hypothetical protein